MNSTERTHETASASNSVANGDTPINNSPPSQRPNLISSKVNSWLESSASHHGTLSANPSANDIHSVLHSGARATAGTRSSQRYDFEEDEQNDDDFEEDADLLDMPGIDDFMNQLHDDSKQPDNHKSANSSKIPVPNYQNLLHYGRLNGFPHLCNYYSAKVSVVLIPIILKFFWLIPVN